MGARQAPRSAFRRVSRPGLSSGRIDYVDPLAGVLSTYVLVHVGPLLAPRAAVGAFETGRDAALVPKMTLQTFHHGVTVPALRAHVVLSLATPEP